MHYRLASRLESFVIVTSSWGRFFVSRMLRLELRGESEGMLFQFGGRRVAFEMRFQLLKEPEERALVGVLIAGEVPEHAFVLFGPVIGIGRKLPFDVFQVLLRSFEVPMRAYRFLDQRAGYLGLRLVMPKPGITKRFELGWIFVAQD